MENIRANSACELCAPSQRNATYFLFLQIGLGVRMKDNAKHRHIDGSLDKAPLASKLPIMPSVMFLIDFKASMTMPLEGFGADS